jgi:hypothetical protein
LEPSSFIVSHQNDVVPEISGKKIINISEGLVQYVEDRPYIF